MTDAKKAVVKAAKQEPTSEELRELGAVISSGGTELTPVQVKLTWLYAQKRGLDVISRQLIPTVMKGKLTFITTIDGFRVIAERSGDYAGQDPIKYQTTQPDGKGKLEWAEATVYRHSWGDRGLTVRAYWDEFKPGGGKDWAWQQMPHVMLGKVAEAQALRKAFPNDMSGMYSDDEMAQAGTDPVQATAQQLAQRQDAEAEGHVAQAEGPDNAEVVDEEEAKSTGERVRYIRRRNGETDDDWQERLVAQDGLVSKSQAEWLVERGIEPTTAASQVHGAAVETIEVPPDAKVVSQALEESGQWDGRTERRKRVMMPHPGRRSTDNAMPDADVDPSRGGSTEPKAAPYPDLPEPGDVTAEAAKTFADELPIQQGEEGTLLQLEGAIVVSSQEMTTAKGNEVVVVWVTDKQSRIECVMAAQLAPKGLGQGEVVEVKGTWTNVGERLVVLAMHIRPA